MKKPILAIIMMIALIIYANSSMASDIVTITYPDGTVVQMSVEEYPILLRNSLTGTAPQPDDPGTTTAVPWPTYTLTRYPLEPILKLEATSGADDEFTGVFSIEEVLEYKRVMAYLGPSRNYAETAAYKPNKMARADGLFIEGSYVFVDMNYPSVGVRRTYFSKGTFKSTGSVPEVTLIGYPAVTTQSIDARYGPGYIYDPFPEASIAAGTALTVFFEEDGYVFAEYEAGSELVRAWIVADSVAPQ